MTFEENMDYFTKWVQLQMEWFKAVTGHDFIPEEWLK